MSNRFRTFTSLPDPYPRSLLAENRARFRASGTKLIVVDDDPTGTQTIASAALITAWQQGDVDWLVEDDDDVGFILTNTRALGQAEAVATNRVVGERLRAASERTGRALQLVSRSDSTLRGHFPSENRALSEGFGGAEHGTLVVPFFKEGGRVTVDGTHYVKESTGYVPAATTPFAKDASFGFENSELRAWVNEKSHGEIAASDVGLIDIAMLRTGGPDAVAAYLGQLPAGSVCACDAFEYSDLDVLVAAVLAERERGRSWLYRSAASLVPALAGTAPAQPVQAPANLTDRGGLVIVGSHVPMSSLQLTKLLELPGVLGHEASAQALTDPAAAAAEITRLVETADVTMASGATAVVYTSRSLVEGTNPLATSELVARGLCAFVDQLQQAPAFLVAKGGITAHTIAVQGLGVRHARVLGPILPGVPMLALDEATKFPHLPYVVFPGNVGDESALRRVVEQLVQGSQ